MRFFSVVFDWPIGTVTSPRPSSRAHSSHHSTTRIKSTEALRHFPALDLTFGFNCLFNKISILRHSWIPEQRRIRQEETKSKSRISITISLSIRNNRANSFENYKLPKFPDLNSSLETLRQIIQNI